MRAFVALVACAVGAACGPTTRAPVTPARPAVIGGRAPDFDGNGYADLAVGAPGAQAEEIGRVFVYLGSAAGWRPSPTLVLAGPDVVGAAYGAALASGDFDGDGLADLAVAAPGQDDLGGRVYLYKGGAHGLATEPWRVLAGEAGPGGSFGAALAAAGDLTGDGFVDLVVGAPDVAGGGRAYVYAGGPAGLPERATMTYFGDSAQAGRFGASVAGAGDVNGDKLGELVIGAPEGAWLAGQASIFAGASERLSPVPLVVVTGAAGRVEQLGAHVAGVGDLNGDGFADVVLAAPLAEGGRGRLEVHRGARGGLVPDPAAIIANPDGPDGDGAQLGVALVAAGDVDGDGLADFVAGESRYRAFTGRVHYYRGSRGVQLSRPARSWTGPAGTYASFGAVLAGGGDADGDGFAEIVVAAPGARRVFVYAGGADGPADAPTLVLPAPPGTAGNFGSALAVTPSR
jgi:hypothetical protein